MADFRTLLLLASALGLAGCNMAPAYVQLALPVPPAGPVGPAYPATDGATVIVPAETAWQDFFLDDKLRAVIGLAVGNNRDLRIAIANVEQARALYRVQRADLFPTLGANADANFQRLPQAAAATGAVGGGVGGGSGNLPGSSGRLDIYSASAGISAWELDLFGRVRNLNEAALQQFLAVTENRNATQTALVAELANAYLLLAADQERLRIARELEGVFGQTLELTRARFRSGIASELEVRQAQTSHDQARSDIAELTTLVAQDQNALNLLAGSTVAPELLPTGLGTGSSTLDNLPAELDSGILLGRPDIVAAEHQLRAANADIGAARAAFFPRISLTAALGTVSLGLSNLFTSQSDFWSVNPQASVPIFDFGRNSGNLRYAKARQQAMIAEYERAIQSAFREVADALARRGTIDDQLAAQTSLREASATAFRLSEARFRSGIDPFLATLDAQRALYAAERSLVATRLAREANAVELYRALGGGLRSQPSASPDPAR
jgi:multidrug efflux system outer membrane protein